MYPCLVDRTREVKSLAESHTADNRPSLYPTDSKLLSDCCTQLHLYGVPAPERVKDSKGLWLEKLASDCAC